MNADATNSVRLDLNRSNTDETQWKISWQGEAGCMYGLQDSPDLINWSWMNLQYSQESVFFEKNFTQTKDAHFFRLKYTDDATEPLFTGDFDLDGLNNYFEVTYSATIGLNPLDPDSNDNGVLDGLEDTDGDGISDSDEAAYGFDPLVKDALLDLDGDLLNNLEELKLGSDPTLADTNGNGIDDALDDHDGDRYPNIYELRNPNGNPRDALVVPTPTYSVPADFSNIQDAIDAINTEYAIVLVESGTYQPVSLRNKMLLISRNGPADTILDGQNSGTVVYLNDLCTLDGFSVTRGGSDYYDGGVETYGRSMIAHCLIYDNNTPFYEYSAGGIMAYGDDLIVLNSRVFNNFPYGIDSSLSNRLTVIHSTLYNNEYDFYSSDGVAPKIINSIIWNDVNENGITYTYLSAEVQHSIIKGTSGYTDANGTVFNTEPNLDAFGRLTKSSTNAIDQATDLNIQIDIDFEARPLGQAFDIGADEFSDVDGDGLPDWLENLGVAEPLGDEDGDNIANIDEYENGLDALNPDTDFDGLNDGEEINEYNTDPLNPDTDGDSLLDGEEIENSLNPVESDAMADLDGDGYPNIYELRRVNGDPNNNEVVPDADFTVSVDGSTDHSTLQSAIDAAITDYSIILVETGTYTGTDNGNFKINSNNPAILIISRDGAEVTILDGEQSLLGGSIFSSGSALAGFTVRNYGGYSGANNSGGALYIDANEILITKCVITNNLANLNGGALYVAGNEIYISKCTIKNNSSSGDGGAIYFDGRYDDITARIESCKIYNNSASDGGGIYTYRADNMEIENTLVYNNVATSQGGGIYTYYSTGIELVYTTVFNNVAPTGSEIYKQGGETTDFMLTNSIVWNDGDALNVLSGSDLSASFSIIRGNSGYSIEKGWVVNQDPLLTTSGHLTSNSPAIDRILESFLKTDIDGDGRPYSLYADIGADEAIGSIHADGDTDSDGLRDWWELLYGLDITIDNQTTDTDNDGLLDTVEFNIGTSPIDADSDDDGLTDGQEVQLAGTNPLVADDFSEVDTDLNADGIDDSIGLSIGISFYESDNDGDGLNNAEELELGTNLLVADTDGDGIDDAIDEFPLDPDLSTRPIDGGDTSAPVIVLLTPPQATLL